MGSLLGLSFSLIDDVLENLKRQHYVGVKKSLGMGNMSGIFALTESGRNLAREHLSNNQYAGPAPVPLYQYAEVVRRQKLADNWLKVRRRWWRLSNTWWSRMTFWRRSARP